MTEPGPWVPVGRLRSRRFLLAAMVVWAVERVSGRRWQRGRRVLRRMVLRFDRQPGRSGASG